MHPLSPDPPPGPHHVTDPIDSRAHPDGTEGHRGAGRSVAAAIIGAAAGVALAATVVCIATAGPAYAGASAAPADLNTVINNLRNWLVGLLVALATLCLTIGGIRYLLASGDPGEVGKAKEALKYAAIGYGVAVLAPGLVEILKGIVGT